MTFEPRQFYTFGPEGSDADVWPSMLHEDDPYEIALSSGGARLTFGWYILGQHDIYHDSTGTIRHFGGGFKPKPEQVTDDWISADTPPDTDRTVECKLPDGYIEWGFFGKISAKFYETNYDVFKPQPVAWREIKVEIKERGSKP